MAAVPEHSRLKATAWKGIQGHTAFPVTEVSDTCSLWPESKPTQRFHGKASEGPRGGGGDWARAQVRPEVCSKGTGGLWVLLCVPALRTHFLGLHRSPAILGTLTQPWEHCDNG